MRQFSVFFLVLILFGGCTKATQNGTGDQIPRDTVYDGDILWREKLESKRPTIQLDNGTGDRPRFVIGDTSVLRIRIPRFNEYGIHLEGIVGATVIKIDSAHNKFLVIPRESQFSVELSQYYPKGQVIRYTRNWNEAKAVYDEQIVSLDSMIKIATLDLKAE